MSRKAKKKVVVKEEVKEEKPKLEDTTDTIVEEETVTNPVVTSIPKEAVIGGAEGKSPQPETVEEPPIEEPTVEEPPLEASVEELTDAEKFELLKVQLLDIYKAATPGTIPMWYVMSETGATSIQVQQAWDWLYDTHQVPFTRLFKPSPGHVAIEP